MKKKLIGSLLGLVACAAVSSANAQGFVNFVNYYVDGSANIIPAGAVTIAPGGAYVGSDYTAELLYSFGANLDTVWTSAGTVSFAGTTGGSPLVDGSGLFFSTQLTIAGYTSGAIDFIVRAFNGTSYANSTITGQSSIIKTTGIATGATPAGDLFTGTGPGTVTSPLTAFTVSATPVPEPSTLALAGLGGFGMLMALRRKKA